MNDLGKIIKIARLDRNMTQKELGQNICTQATISNIEKSGSIPSKEILLKIANRLNIEFDDVYGFINEDATENNKIMKQVKIFCRKFQHKDAGKLLNRFDEKSISSSNEEKEYYYYKGITSLVGSENFSDAHYYFNIVNSIPVENEISIYELLSNNGIGAAYFMKEEDEKAKKYAEKTLILLEEYLENGYDKKYTSEIIRIYFNTAKILSKVQKYQEAVKLCSLGLDLLQLNDNFFGMENLLYEKAYNLCMLNKKTEAEEFYFYAAAIARLNKNKVTTETISKNMKEYGLMHYKY
ncbi:helix-turn-helix transcriptional regulator [Carnobacterium maltaromaticum]|uniref:helix-turn-helix domain-containing protein n=1 Tax=Carnobacterium maltaromaticum TaxID=2751 RepID=UPI00295EF964|nr:helix-turn-helix transcriptional regulator [Carnobacterium maltaromaticum]